MSGLGLTKFPWKFERKGCYRSRHGTASFVSLYDAISLGIKR